MNPTNLHILIAEDDPDDGFLIADSFRQNTSYNKVSFVQNGQELVDFLKSNAAPDAILTDINMPLKDGIEALTEIMDDPNLKDIPCFVYSTAINPVYETRCRELGIKGFLIKPYSLEEFNEIPLKIISILATA